METDNELTSGTHTGTEETVGSSEMNADEAEAITRSMDMSIAFWGTSKEPPEKIPASRLKCPQQHPGKAARVALKIWDKMTQRDLDKVKEIEVSLMTDGEIGTLDLFNSLKYIVESIGMEFEEMLKSVDDDPIESTISLTNEILHIFNLNEPPEILEDEEYRSYIQYSPVSNVCKQTERQKKEISNKMKMLLNRAHQMGIHDVRIPSSPYLTERSKLSLIEKQITSKMKLRNVKKIFEDTETDCSYGESKYGQSLRFQKRKSSHQKKECKRSTLADRPKFRTAVKSETVRYEDLFKHTPDITKRIRRVREIRKKFLEKSKNNSDPKSSSNLFNGRSARSRHLANAYNNYSNYNLSYKGRTPRAHKRYHLPQLHNACIRDYSLRGNASSTRVIIGSCSKPQNDDSFDQSSNTSQGLNSKDSMLYEMKKMVNEAVQAVTGSNRLKHTLCMSDEKKTFRIRARERNRNNKTGIRDFSRAMQSTTNFLRSREENSNPVSDKKRKETFVTVKQEAGVQHTKKEDNKVSTEVKVCRDFGGPGLKVSVISKVSGNEETEDLPRPRSKKDIQEAISILKEYIALKNNESLTHIEAESVQNAEDGSLMLTKVPSEELIQEKNITSETVAKTEVIIEPNSIENLPKEEEEEHTKSSEYQTWGVSHDGIDESDRTYQTYAVTMLMPMVSGVEESRFYSPFQLGGMFLNRPNNRTQSDQVGDVGDNNWSSWDSPIWQRIHLDDGYTTNLRNESDSLYVNTSEERIDYNGVGESGEDGENPAIESTISTISMVVVENDARSGRSSYASMISAAASGIYRIFINSILGAAAIFFKPFRIIAAIKLRRNENDQ